MVATDDCAGNDRTSPTASSTPEPTECNAGTLGQSSVCWDGSAYLNPNLPGQMGCAYKSVAPSQCTGGTHPGLVHQCQLVDPSCAGGTGGTGGTYQWVEVRSDDCAGQDRAGPSTSADPDPAECSASTLGLSAVCWDGATNSNPAFPGQPGCLFKSVTSSQCSGGPSPGLLHQCQFVPDNCASTYHWVAVGIEDCTGHDRAGVTPGDVPTPTECNGTTLGLAAVCWDGVTYPNNGFSGAGCTYKDVTPGACSGGINPGYMYECVFGP